MREIEKMVRIEITKVILSRGDSWALVKYRTAESHGTFGGNFGCLEAYLGKEGILRTAKEKIEFSSGSTHLHKIIPSELGSKDIYKFARKEDPVAVDITDSIADHPNNEGLLKSGPNRHIMSSNHSQFNS